MQGTFVRAFLACSLMATAAQGAILWTATLNQAQEVPPTGSPGTGAGTVSYDAGATTLIVLVTWSGLTAPTVAGHIHCCVPPGGNGPVAVPFPGLPAVEAGSYSNTFDLSTASVFGADFLAARSGDVTAARNDLLAGLDGGLAYFNLHTGTNPSGEIRGNIAAAALTDVPEPPALSLVLVGLALVGLARLGPKLN